MTFEEWLNDEYPNHKIEFRAIDISVIKSAWDTSRNLAFEEAERLGEVNLFNRNHNLASSS